MATENEKYQTLLVDIEELIAVARRSITSPPAKLGRRSSAEVRTLMRGLLLLTPTDARPSLTRFFNAYSSVIDELNEGDLTQRDAEREFVKIERELSAISSALAPATQELSDTTSALARNQKVRSKLQSLITRMPVVLSEAPIVPMVHLNVPKLQSVGIACTELIPREGSRATGLGTQSLQGYASLDKQRVVGISRAYIESIVEDKAAGASRRLKESTVIEEAFQDVLDTFHHKHPGYEVIGVPTSWWEARWYWVIPKRELITLRRVGGTALSVSKWNFAFQS